MACEIEDRTRWAKPQGNPTLVTEDSQKALPDSDSNIIAKSPISELKKMRMSKEERERALHMVFLIDGLIPRGYHIVLFGNAGSGKTTVMLHLCMQMLLGNPKTEIYFFYLDGQLGMAANYENYLEERGLYERFNILTSVELEHALTLLEQAVSRGECKPEDIVVVLDTLKYLNPNIINKDANVKAMQRIKRLTKLGITFISLHHTNKDGENFAGTADIEQDGDAILKIVTAPGDTPHSMVSTIQEGGRVRYLMEPRTYSFTKGDPISVKELDEVLEPEKILQLEKDSHAIGIIKGILNLSGELTKTQLEEMLKEDDDFDYGEKERKRILKAYKDIHWKIRKGGEMNRNHFYSAIDNTSEHIDGINQQIAVCGKGA